MNSQDYWNTRFRTDWTEFEGEKQTTFFAETLVSMLPDWLVHEINENAYDVCDLGCAEGDALTIYKQTFMRSHVAGEDFSEQAIQNAHSRYPEFEFRVNDILHTEGQTVYPVVVCSNVVEHFKDTYQVLAKICERTTKYAIVMFPYREPEGKIEEHEHIFRTNNIPLLVEEGYLIYAKTKKCDSIYYPYEQILLIYAKENKYAFLSDVVENVSCNSEIEMEEKLAKLLSEKEELISGRRDELEELEARCEEQKARYEEQKARYEEQKARCEEYRKLLDKQEEASGEQRRKLEESVKEYASKNENLSSQIKQIQTILENKEKELVCAEKNEEQRRKLEESVKEYASKNENLSSQIKQIQTTLANKEKELAYAEKYIQGAKDILRQKDEHLTQAQIMCEHFATGKLMRLNHFCYRMKDELFKGNRDEKREFWHWMKGRLLRTNRTIGKGEKYNPWMILRKKLQEAVGCRIAEAGIGEHFLEGRNVENAMQYERLSVEQQGIIEQDYTKYDVIILSVIDYNFRYQRPQHFASRFAANGHRVFYVNANFVRPDSVSLYKENLYAVDFSCENHNAIYTMSGMDTLEWMKKKFDSLMQKQAIRDAIVIVDYPNWVYGAEFIREKYGFKVITDYMDDYTGFLGTAEDFLKSNCIRLLQISDKIVPSSKFLCDVAGQYVPNDKITIVRNGTEVNHFYQAVSREHFDKERKVIGYYGAVAHWFAWEKVCYLAKRFSECDIVIVGDVTEYRDKLERHANIKLLGEKPYAELPGYLADFDVCLIPFDTSTDLIKATNPVKFYEYLSAGKKVVATEIPELMPYVNEYVYMSNDNEQFAQYVQMCLEGTDTLKGKNECIQFAEENDWQKRYECFAAACEEYVPTVSIVVLTYNNMNYNVQCIESILTKTAYANYELIVVDNCSNDGTVEYLRGLEHRNSNNVKVIFNTANLGFAGGNNVGIRASRGKYVLLLNNDTVVTRGWITAMVKHLENNSLYGMCNPVTNSIGNESKIPVCYTNLKEMHEFAYSVTSENMNREYTDVDRLPLFATLIRREVINTVGMLDETYKIGMFEDDDYTEAVKAANYGIVIAEDAFVHHINNGTFKKMEDAEYKKIFDANKAVYEKKWNKKWQMPKYREGVTADCNCLSAI